MKLTIALLCVAGLGYVCGESCRSNDDCKRHHTTHCHSHTDVVCNNNFCECTSAPIAGRTCKDKTECTGITCNQNESVHCIDSNCRCTLRIPGGI